MFAKVIFGKQASFLKYCLFVVEFAFQKRVSATKIVDLSTFYQFNLYRI